MKTYIKCDCIKNSREFKNQIVFYGQAIVFENGRRVFAENSDIARLKQSDAMHDARIIASDLACAIKNN